MNDARDTQVQQLLLMQEQLLAHAQMLRDQAAAAKLAAAGSRRRGRRRRLSARADELHAQAEQADLQRGMIRSQLRDIRRTAQSKAALR